MRLPHTRRMTAGLVVVGLLGLGVASAALARAAALGSGTSREKAASAQRRAQKAIERALALGGRVDRLEADLRMMSSARDRLGRRLNRLAGRLRRTAASVHAAKRNAGSALSEAASAVDAAAKNARDLAVLTKRFDYHLRHGGP